MTRTERRSLRRRGWVPLTGAAKLLGMATASTLRLFLDRHNVGRGFFGMRDGKPIPFYSVADIKAIDRSTIKRRKHHGKRRRYMRRNRLALPQVDVKKCTRCGIVKSRPEFPKRSASRDGMASWCKQCHSEYGNAKRMMKAVSTPDVIQRGSIMGTLVDFVPVARAAKIIGVAATTVAHLLDKEPGVLLWKHYGKRNLRYYRLSAVMALKARRDTEQIEFDAKVKKAEALPVDSAEIPNRVWPDAPKPQGKFGLEPNSAAFVGALVLLSQAMKQLGTALDSIVKLVAK